MLEAKSGAIRMNALSAVSHVGESRVKRRTRSSYPAMASQLMKTLSRSGSGAPLVTQRRSHEATMMPMEPRIRKKSQSVEARVTSRFAGEASPP